MEVGRNTKIIAGMFTLLILGLIVFAGPAKAFVLNLVIVDDLREVDKGESIKFIATLDIEAVDKFLPIESLTLILDGPEKRRPF